MEINGKPVDYDLIKKVTIGDIEDLEATGLDLNKMNQGEANVRQLIDFIAFFAHRVNSDITREDVRSLGVNELADHAEQITQRVNQAQEHVGSPSS